MYDLCDCKRQGARLPTGGPQNEEGHSSLEGARVRPCAAAAPQAATSEPPLHPARGVQARSWSCSLAHCQAPKTPPAEKGVAQTASALTSECWSTQL